VTKAELRETWEARVAAYRASGQSASEWCAAHQVTTRQLWYWMQKFKETKEKAAPSSQWITVKVDKETQEAESALLVRIGSAAIEVKPGYNQTLFADVVRTLQTLC